MRHIKFIDKTEFIVVILSLKIMMFIVYKIFIFESIIIIVYYSKNAQTMFLKLEKVIILNNYFNLINIFLFNFVIELINLIGINNNIINLADNK